MPVVSKLGSLLESTPPHQLPDLFVMAIDASYDERLAVLNELDPVARFETALALLDQQLLMLSAAAQILNIAERETSTGERKDEGRGEGRQGARRRPPLIVSYGNKQQGRRNLKHSIG